MNNSILATGNTGLTNAAAASRAGENSLLAGTQEQFLTLLVTQLRNQDPLNPLDNEGVTSQIAQLSTVDGINRLNDTLLALSGQMDLSQSMQAANLIGKQVLVPGEKIALGSTDVDGQISKSATPFGLEFIAPAENVVVTIHDVSGTAVRRLELDPQAAGVVSLQWDGLADNGQPLNDGAYTAQVKASDAKGQPVPAEVLTSGTVSSVAYSSAGLKIELGLAGSYSLNDIRQIM